MVRVMVVNAEVEKNDGESTTNLIRRFTKRVQGARLIQNMRERRYFTREKSREVKRKHTLKVIKRREEVAELIKLGKLLEKTTLRPRRK